jgi:hypothetical protein
MAFLYYKRRVPDEYADADCILLLSGAYMATYLQVLDAPFVSRRGTRYFFQLPNGLMKIHVEFYVSFEFTKPGGHTVAIDYGRDVHPEEFMPDDGGYSFESKPPNYADVLKTSDDHASEGLMMLRTKDIVRFEMAEFNGSSPTTFLIDQVVDFAPFRGQEDIRIKLKLVTVANKQGYGSPGRM